MSSLDLTPYEEGLIVGLLIGEGHFGGDGRRPQVTLKMHVRHETLLRWLQARIPSGRLYGPYHHDGRHFYQWMSRGTSLRDDLMPLLERHVHPELDNHAYARISAMREKYPTAFDPRESPE